MAMGTALAHKLGDSSSSPSICVKMRSTEVDAYIPALGKRRQMDDWVCWPANLAQ